jgi:hypothetical protein
MRWVKYLALLSMLTVLWPLCAWARVRDQHSVDIYDSLKVGAAQLRPGNYKVEWQEAGPSVHVRFRQEGKTVATVPATLKMNDAHVRQDDVVMRTVANQKVLEEIDFGHPKAALVFGQHSGGR